MPYQTDNGGSRLSSGEDASSRLHSGSQLTPHDSLFKMILGKPEHAASQLRAVLPQNLAGRLDLEQLVQVPGTFVDETLRQRHSDLLFSAPLDGRDAFVFVLMEHQSTSDPLMAYRMLRYIARIWDRYLDQNPRARRMPPVIPLVVYNGKSQWSAPRRLEELIDPALGVTGDEGDAEYLPRFSFLLDDLAIIDFDQLRGRDTTPTVRVTLVSMKDAPDNPLAHEVLWKLFDELRAMLRRPGGLEEFKALLAYIRDVGEAPDSEIGRVADALGPEAKEAYVTTAEMLEAQGEARGETRGEARMLIRVLTAKFGSLPESASRRVTEASRDQLDTWGTRAVTAKTLDEVFS